MKKFNSNNEFDNLISKEFKNNKFEYNKFEDFINI